MVNRNDQRDKLLDRTRKALQPAAEYMHSGDSAYTLNNVIETIIIFISAALVAISLNMFVFQIIRVDGISMEPTFWTDERVFAEKLSYQFSTPERKDVVICRYHLDFEESERMIKRVIGLPGERVRVTGGKIYVDDQQLDESGYWNDIILLDMDEVQVPEDHYFVVGDNRNHSWDSRSQEAGPVPIKNILGHVVFVIWPFNRFGGFPT